MASFKCDPLPDAKTHIRILTLQKGQPGQPLYGSLEQAALDSLPNYEATSYCVGNTAKRDEIWLSTTDSVLPLPITKNLFDMLQRLRSPEKSLRLWVDAISINQANAAEREDQVFIMKSIYTNAQKVLIYLGEPNETTPSAIQLLTEIYQAWVENPPNPDLTPLEWQEYHKMPLATEHWRWEPLKDFFCRPWFTRKWTIQECVLGREVCFICGSWEADWHFMDNIQQAIWNTGLAMFDYAEHSNEDMRLQLQQGLAQFNAIAAFKRAFLKGTRFQLMDAIYHFQTSRATDLRDHLFALLGLASDSNHEALVPKYQDTTILDNCLRYAWHFFRAKKNLEVLYRAGLHGNKLLAPSWIPNWYGKQTGFAFEYAQGLWDPLRRPPFYNIARGTEMDLIPTEDQAVIGVKGVAIATIQDLANQPLSAQSEQMPERDRVLAQKRQHLEESETLLNLLAHYPTGEPLQTVFWRTLICGVDKDLQRAPNQLFANAYEAWRRLLRKEFANGQEASDLSQQQRPFREAIDFSNADKILGTLDSGYVGMFPRSARRGDTVAVFYGGEFPFIIRNRQGKASDQFELIGQCYIHGMMEEGQLNITDRKKAEQYFYLGGDYQVEQPYQPSDPIPLVPSKPGIKAPAYHLYLPPTSIKPRFVMVEESTHTFYDVDTITPRLGNPSSWAQSGLSRNLLGSPLAIVITQELNADEKATLSGRGYVPNFDTATLVKITSQVGDTIHAKSLGKANICQFPPGKMSWEILKDMKGAVLPDEMKNGLLGKLYGGLHPQRAFVHPEVLAKMPRKWHIDAEALNYELDGIFASGLLVPKGQVRWVLS